MCTCIISCVVSVFRCVGERVLGAAGARTDTPSVRPTQSDRLMRRPWAGKPGKTQVLSPTTTTLLINQPTAEPPDALRARAPGLEAHGEGLDVVNALDRRGPEAEEAGELLVVHPPPLVLGLFGGVWMDDLFVGVKENAPPPPKTRTPPPTRTIYVYVRKRWGIRVRQVSLLFFSHLLTPSIS